MSKQRRLVGMTVLATLLSGCSKLPVIEPTHVGGHDAAFQDALHQEDPLELGETILALEPTPTPTHADQVYFSAFSRSFVWFEGEDHQPGSIFCAELGGPRRPLGQHHGNARVLGWSADGAKVLVGDQADAIQPSSKPDLLERPLLFDLAMASPTAQVVGEFPSGPDGFNGLALQLLPTGAECWENVIADQAGTKLPGPISDRYPRQLYLLSPGSQPQYETTLGGPGIGRWSPDGHLYAHLEYRDGDPVKGLALKTYDRSTKAFQSLLLMETDDSQAALENLSWLGNDEVYLTTTCQTAGSASIQLSRVTVGDRTGHLRVARLSLQTGERLGPVFLSPDKRALAFEVTAQEPVTVNGMSGVTTRSHGVFLAALASGKVARLLPRGHVVTWLPGSQELVCATGRGDHTRYYRVDASTTRGGL